MLVFCFSGSCLFKEMVLFVKWDLGVWFVILKKFCVKFLVGVLLVLFVVGCMFGEEWEELVVDFNYGVGYSDGCYMVGICV